MVCVFWCALDAASRCIRRQLRMNTLRFIRTCTNMSCDSPAIASALCSVSVHQRRSVYCAVTLVTSLLFKRPSYGLHYASCPSTCPVQACYRKTKKCTKTNIGIDAALGTSKWSATISWNGQGHQMSKTTENWIKTEKASCLLTYLLTYGRPIKNRWVRRSLGLCYCCA